MKGIVISSERAEEAVGYYESGDSIEEVSQKTGISTGAVSSRISRKAKIDPDLMGTHEVARFIRENHLTSQTLIRGAEVLDELEELQVSLDDLEKYVLPFLKQVKDPVECCKAGVEYQAAVKSTGKTRDELIREQLEKSKSLDVLTKKEHDTKVHVEKLQADERVLGSEVEDLKVLKTISQQLTRIGKTPEDAEHLLGLIESFLKRGFTLNVLDIICKELAKIQTTPDEAATILVKLLEKYRGLEEGLSTLEANREDLEQTVSGLKRRKVSLESGVSELENRTKDLINDFGRRQSSYEEESSNFERQQALLHDKLRKEEEMGNQRIRALDDETRRKQGIVAALRKEEITRSARLRAADELWKFIVEGKKPTSGSIYSYLGTGRVQARLPLTEPVRGMFVRAMATLVMNDDLFRIGQLRKIAARERRDYRTHLRKTWKVKESIERRISILLDIQHVLKSEPDVLKALSAKAISDPRYFQAVLEQPAEKLIEAIAMLPIFKREKFREIFRKADRLADELEDRRFNMWCDGMLNQAMEQILNPAFNGMPVYRPLVGNLQEKDHPSTRRSVIQSHFTS